VTPVLAIDGPSGAGKSTVARVVAEVLHLDVLDTGAMYRAVTLAVLDGGVDPSDAAGCAAVARRVPIDQQGPVTRLDGRDVSAAIRSPEVTGAVSTVAAHPAVRAVLVEHQRRWAATHGEGVVEGRDIGTVVFPDAMLKVFLTASDDERARRRRDEHDPDGTVSVDAVRAELGRRDHLDTTRAASPLAPAVDAMLIDTTGRPVRDVVDEIVAQYRVRRVAPR
jgi:cytidylate kinase